MTKPMCTHFVLRSAYAAWSVLCMEGAVIPLSECTLSGSLYGLARPGLQTSVGKLPAGHLSDLLSDLINDTLSDDAVDFLLLSGSRPLSLPCVESSYIGLVYSCHGGNVGFVRLNALLSAASARFLKETVYLYTDELD